MNEAEHRPVVAVETVRPFGELFDALEQAGFNTEHRAPREQRAAPVVEALAIYLTEKLADPEIERVTTAVRGWVESWLRPFLGSRGQGGEGRSISIYGPQGEVLSRVDIDED
jgi:hypothetical protein